ncbi:hypothetical protein IWQ51_004158 [Labrenzia sp. EL_142]|nr:hypothetical protein [Labrenzia sp. EL_142]
MAITSKQRICPTCQGREFGGLSGTLTKCSGDWRRLSMASPTRSVGGSSGQVQLVEKKASMTNETMIRINLARNVFRFAEIPYPAR